MTENLFASGGKALLTEVWHFGSSVYRRDFHDIDLLLIYDDGADWRAVASIRTGLESTVTELVGTPADILALSTSESKGLGHWLTGPAERIWIRAEQLRR